jgi:hypothetical protein
VPCYGRKRQRRNEATHKLGVPPCSRVLRLDANPPERDHSAYMTNDGTNMIEKASAILRHGTDKNA